MKYRYLGLAGIALAVAACDNPADKTTDAKVSAPVEKASLSTEGGTKYVFTSNSEVTSSPPRSPKAIMVGSRNSPGTSR